MPAQPAEGSAFDLAYEPLDAVLLDELWRASDGNSVGLSREQFGQILGEIGARQKYGLEDGEKPSYEQRAGYLRGLKLVDLALARACAAGNERAWERFIAHYRQPLERAAIAITGSATLGRELADQLYGELYGLTERDGERRCPLESYCGRGSLMGWLRTVIAQRHVDHLRRHKRDEPLEEFDTAAPEVEQGQLAPELSQLEKAIESAIGECDAEERLILAAYYLDGRRLLDIAGVLNVHEGTVSRKLKRACEQMRKRVVKSLQLSGMSRRAADEVLVADPRDLDVNVKKLLQCSQFSTFNEKER
jgi:RNA polymerase sigma-70 factor (ECF subfamily)